MRTVSTAKLLPYDTEVRRRKKGNPIVLPCKCDGFAFHYEPFEDFEKGYHYMISNCHAHRVQIIGYVGRNEEGKMAFLDFQKFAIGRE